MLLAQYLCKRSWPSEVFHHMRLRNINGFTLVELLVSMGIGMVVLAAVTTTFMSQTRIYNAQEQINEMQQNARGALDIISREVKMAGYRPTGMALTGITYSSTQLQIQADLSGNALLTESDEIVTYAFDSTNNRITRQNGTSPAQVLAEHITAFTFSYFNATGTATTVSANIRQVSITITAKTAKPDPNFTANGGYRIYTVSATITPGNLAL
jgi:type IV pilus assembly protein PilW